MRTKNVLLIALSISAYSCSQDESLNFENPDSNLFESTVTFVNQSDFNFKISDEEAKKQLQFFIGNTPEASTRSSSTIEIINDGKICYTSESANTRSGAAIDTIGVYKFTVKSGKDEGYGLVCDDKRCFGVIAYCESGSLNDTLFNKGLAEYMRNLPKSLSNKINGISETLNKPHQYKKNNYDSKTRAGASWGGGEIIPEDGQVIPAPWLDRVEVTGNTVKVYTDTHVEIYKTLNKNFRVPVKWGQDSPYNNLVPKVCAYGKAPAGCTAVAVAQIMAYHKFPPTYNWDLLTSKPKISSYLPEDEARRNEVARLITDIGTKVHMDYQCDGSASNINYALAAMKQYGYSSSSGVQTFFEIATSYWPFESVKVFNSPLAFNEPVYVRGDNDANEGHAFVMDGLFEYNAFLFSKLTTFQNGLKVSEEDSVEPYGLLMSTVSIHINWGWDGSSDGYFEQYPRYLPFSNNKKYFIPKL